MGQRRSVAAWDDTWRTEMKCAFPGPRQLRVAVVVSRNSQQLQPDISNFFLPAVTSDRVDYTVDYLAAPCTYFGGG